jgi:hypothetical protein
MLGCKARDDDDDDNFKYILYTIASITFCSYITIRMPPIQMYSEINCIVSYIIDKFHIQQVITPMD